MIETQQHEHYICIALLVHYMMEEDAVLQRRQRIDVLHVGCATGNVVNNALDLGRAERDERQHLRSNGFTVWRNQVGWNLGQLASSVCSRSQFRQRVRGKYCLYVC